MSPQPSITRDLTHTPNSREKRINLAKIIISNWSAMVHRPADDHQGARRRRTAAATRGAGGRQQQQREALVPAAQPALVRLPCNKGKACRFKRSCFSEEEDAASAAILLLACVVCSPS
ncbi:hypothetical protein GUJ93_ZPchr0009g543 [Zizania palustris]|uniref:Uncharacterized protein n=1 Tax=Zizania palustris TaxID=103762 RepID=A0A8J5VN73_ZIZPA|nr:hypothetical protein GUJ93_ZPchr0009g543 [Zizania palustris]